MGPTPRSKSKPKALKSGRPPLASHGGGGGGASSSLSSKATARTIRTHHTLHKQLAAARAAGDEATARGLATQIEALGGLKTYQAASTLGQSALRGGDSSRVLVTWLGLTGGRDTSSSSTAATTTATATTRPLRVLEVGALRTDNALDVPGRTVVRRIDLRSNAAGIEEMDFMELPLPVAQGEAYDVLSLSLVLNYVPDARGRGDMLRRTTRFLRTAAERGAAAAEVKEGNDAASLLLLPCLFLVLPLPCVANSRYLDTTRLADIMGALGYVHTRTKESKKLHYSLWRWEGPRPGSVGAGAGAAFKKEELRSGKDRNNFCIILDPEKGST